MAKIVLSNAHCKDAPGAFYNGTTEYDYSCKVNKIIKKLLEEMGHEVTIVDGGNGSATQTLKYKAKLINQINPVAAIENHLNASDNPSASYGAEVIHYQGSTKGEKLAKNLSNRFSYLPVKQKGTTGRNDLYLLKSTRCPAVITEPFFFSHQVEQKLLEFNRGVDVVGKLIAEGINSWVTMI